jgi:dihydrofolate reductase
MSGWDLFVNPPPNKSLDPSASRNQLESKTPSPVRAADAERSASAACLNVRKGGPPKMRKLIVCNIVSLDGFFSGPGGNVMAMPFDNGFSDYNAERLRAADTLLLGRKSYEGFRSYWPAIAEDVTQPAVEREISRLNAAIEKVVVSNNLKPDEVEGWGTTRVVRRADAHKEVAALKESAGREILIFGSHLLWNDLLASGLVDELHFMIGAGVVGEGVRAFETKPPPGSLRLLDTRTFDGSSLLLARYAVER